MLALCAELVAEQSSDDVFNHPAELADKELNRVINNANSAKSIQAHFTQERFISGLLKPLKSSGNFVFERSVGICWIVKKPFPLTFVITPDGLTKKEPGMQPVVLSVDKHPAVSKITDAFLALFEGDLKNLNRDFNLYFKNNDNGWLLGLKSKTGGKRDFIKRITLKGEQTLNMFKLLETSQDQTSVSFQEVIESSELLPENKKACFG